MGRRRAARNGKKKLARPTAAASFHLSLNTTGSSSAPARNVRTIAPMPDRNLTQDSSVPSTAEPIAAPMMSWAMVPTTISESAVEMRSQIDSRLAISAKPEPQCRQCPHAGHDKNSCSHLVCDRKSSATAAVLGDPIPVKTFNLSEESRENKLKQTVAIFPAPVRGELGER